MAESSGLLLENVSKSYGRHKVVDNVTLDISSGQIYGLVGPSGCGKTSLVKIMAGILRPDSGRVRIAGRAMPDLDLMKQIGYMAQTAAFYPSLSAYENLEFFGSLYELQGRRLQESIAAAAELVGLQEELKKPFGAYSGGMKQRLSLAVALLHEPAVLLLDEPTVGIDPLLRQSIWQELQRRCAAGATIFLTTHVMDEVGRCARLSIMREGRILASGTPQELKQAAGAADMENAFIYFSRLEQQEVNSNEA